MIDCGFQNHYSLVITVDRSKVLFISRIFKVKESTVLQLLEKVRVHSLWWVKAYNVNVCINSHI
jgi:hypothetical protein